jgi:hypothetical protein
MWQGSGRNHIMSGLWTFMGRSTRMNVPNILTTYLSAQGTYNIFTHSWLQYKTRWTMTVDNVDSKICFMVLDRYSIYLVNVNRSGIGMSSTATCIFKGNKRRPHSPWRKQPLSWSWCIPSITTFLFFFFSSYLHTRWRYSLKSRFDPIIMPTMGALIMMWSGDKSLMEYRINTCWRLFSCGEYLSQPLSRALA